VSLGRRGTFAGALLAFVLAAPAQAQDAAPPSRLLDSIDLDPAGFDSAFGGISAPPTMNGRGAGCC
jgi:opacity protein-like surface antigen